MKEQLHFVEEHLTKDEYFQYVFVRCVKSQII